MKFIKTLILGTTVLLMGCIDAIDVFSDTTPILIVDGGITNLAGRKTIQLKYTKEFNTIYNYEEVNNAVVEVVDDLGNKETFTFNGNGEYYSSDDFVGEIGRTYSLQITLRNGEYYESYPQEMLAPVGMESGSFELTSIEQYSDEGVIYDEERVAFNVNYKDPEATVNYYKWRYQGTFQVLAPDADSYSPEPRSGCPSPAIRMRDCWAKSFDHEYLRVESDQFNNGRTVNGYEVYSEPIDIKFAIGYDAALHCQSISEREYKYWKAIEEQINNNGTIFEKANYQIKGNMYSPDNEDKFVLGYFSVAGVSVTHVFVNYYDVNRTFEYSCEPPNPSACIPIQCVDCRQYSPSSTHIKPNFWPL